MSTKRKHARKKRPGIDLSLMERVVDGLDTSAPDTVLPLLRRTQDVFGYIPREAVFDLARRTGLSPARLYGVATFYDQLRLKPAGRHVVRLCTNVACNVLGAEDLLARLEEVLGVGQGGTTPDGRFTLLAVECIGSCGRGPAMMVDDDFHYDLTEEAVEGVLEGYG